MYFTLAYGMSPGMAVSMVDKGAKYPGTFRDKDGDFLEGGKSYTLHLPPNVPAANFWSMTALRCTDRVGPRQWPAMPLAQSMEKPIKTPTARSTSTSDPPRPPVKRRTGYKPYLARVTSFIFRLYSPEKAFFNQTWKPDDIVKVK